MIFLAFSKIRKRILGTKEKDMFFCPLGLENI